jgi:hypothetical protein
VQNTIAAMLLRTKFGETNGACPIAKCKPIGRVCLVALICIFVGVSQAVTSISAEGSGQTVARRFIVGGVPQPFPGSLNTSLQVSPTQTTAGQDVYFTYSATPPTVFPPFASITTLTLDYGDGNVDLITPGSPGITVSGTVPHAYLQRGIYAATLRATDSDGDLGASAAIIAVMDGPMTATGQTGRFSCLGPTERC